jgi:hypothetical protein
MLTDEAAHLGVMLRRWAQPVPVGHQCQLAHGVELGQADADNAFNVGVCMGAGFAAYATAFDH